jgi:hypothetical protein
MKRLLFIFILLPFVKGAPTSEEFTLDDLLTLSSLSAKDITHFMTKKGYSHQSKSLDDSLVVIHFSPENPQRGNDSLLKRSIDLFNTKDTKYFVLNTSSPDDFIDGKRRLIKAGFFYDSRKEPGKDSSMLFQRKNISIEAITRVKNGQPVYTFLLKKKELPNPASIRYAEDLLCFNSHELLAGFFGESNVKKDFYFFSDKELKKCSVLFSNSSRQVVFVWDDGNNLCNLSYILISNVIPTLSGKEFDGFISNNAWTLKNGVYCGMSIKELLKLNEKDFEFYGNQSEFAFIVNPKSKGNLNFKTFSVTLSCTNCNNDRLFNAMKVNALDVTRENLPMYVYTIIIFPSEHTR